MPATSRSAAAATRSRSKLLHTEGRLAGSATLKQSDWGIKPYSALFGTLKVADEVTVSIDANTGRVRDG